MSKYEFPLYGEYSRTFIRVNFNDQENTFEGYLYEVDGDDYYDRTATHMSEGW